MLHDQNTGFRPTFKGRQIHESQIWIKLRPIFPKTLTSETKSKRICWKNQQNKKQKYFIVKTNLLFTTVSIQRA